MRRITFYALLGLLLFTSCSKRNLTYFSDLEDQPYTEEIQNKTEVKIQADDLLSITVGSLNPEANSLFNSGEVPNIGGMANKTSSQANTIDEGYLVSKEGYIDFPILGKVQLEGLTTTDAKVKLTQQLGQYLKEPMVNIRFLNFKVTVVGEVNSPRTITVPSERINIIEALGMAGDMTAFGKRENVMVIREEKGTRTITHLNLNSKEVLQSPYFYLQQNDVLYVEPVQARAAQASTTRSNVALIISLLSFISIQLYRYL